MTGIVKSNKRAIAFCGTRGVPANYGGFETAVDEISKRFTRLGYDCVVFCRMSSSDKVLAYHEGRKLIYVKGTSIRALDTVVSAIQAGWHLLRHRKMYSHVFWFNNANLPGILLTLLARIPVSVNTDGLEWRRAKWSWPFKVYYFVASYLISQLCKNVISDSKAIQSYYRRRFLRDTHFIPYGIPQVHTHPEVKKLSILDRYGLEVGRYFLQITRFEPDNLPLESAKAFRVAHLAGDGFKLLLIGFQHKTSYTQKIKAMSGRDGILAAEAVYDPEVLSVLRANCFCYVHGNSAGGTNPALLEAMTSCPRVLAIDGPFNREVLGDVGYFFTPDDMAPAFRSALDYPDQSIAMARRVRSRYNWDSVASSYMRLAEEQPAGYLPVNTEPESYNWS